MSKQQSALGKLKKRLKGEYAEVMVGSQAPLFPTKDDILQLKDTSKCEETKDADKYDFSQSGTGKADKGATLYFNVYSVVDRLTRLDSGEVFIKEEEIGGTKYKGKKDPFWAANEPLQEPIIGSRLNLLIEAKIAHAFSRTWDWFVCNDTKNKVSTLATVTELQTDAVINLLAPPGRPDDISTDIGLIRSLLSQLLASLDTAQRSFGYVHYDLHVGNYMYRETRDDNKDKNWRMKLTTGREIFLTAAQHSNHEGRIIDFGRSRLQSPYTLKNDGDLQSTTFGDIIDPGISDSFHGTFDTRRFSLHLVERLLVNTDGKYFEMLKAAWTPEDYTDFIALLNDMCGHRWAFGPDGGPRNKAFYDDIIFKGGNGSWWEAVYWQNIGFGPSSLTKTAKNREDKISEVFTEFRRGGIEQFIQRVVEEINSPPKQKKFQKAAAKEQKQFIPQWGSLFALCWSFSKLKFPGRRPAELLEMAFFKSLHDAPVGDTVTLMEFRSIVRLRSDPPESVDSCLVCAKPVQFECTNCAAPYCSVDCQRDHWHTQHRELCHRDIVF